MAEQTKLLIRLEIIWWITTIVLTCAVLFPIHNALGKINYPFWVSNIVFIAVFITFGRYIFLMKHTWIAFRQWIKVIIAVSCIPLFMYLLDEFNHFQVIADEIGLEELFDHLSLEAQIDMADYIKGEMLFFGAGSLVSTVLMPIRLLISFWRTYNRGTV